jgi:hypothetical protein
MTYGVANPGPSSGQAQKYGGVKSNKMNCELMVTYNTPALRQTGSRNLTGQKTLPRYPISWEVFLDPSDSYFLFADFVDFYTH